MPQTITEKILAAHAGRETVKPGEIITVKVDLVLVNDITGLIADREFRKMGVSKVFDPDRSRHRARPLRARQGHGLGRAVPHLPPLRQGVRHHQLLRCRPRRHRARPAARAGHRGAGRPDHRRRLAHRHLRRHRRLLHRRRRHRRGGGDGPGRDLAARAGDDQVRLQRQAAVAGSPARTSSSTPSARSASTAPATRPWSSPARPSPSSRSRDA